MKPMQINTIRLLQHRGTERTEPWQSVRERGPILKAFASRQTHERPLLIAGSLVALGLIPMAAYVSRRELGRTRVQVRAPEIVLPRNQEWYSG